MRKAIHIPLIRAIYSCARDVFFRILSLQNSKLITISIITSCKCCAFSSFRRFFICRRKLRILQLFVNSNAKIAQMKSMVLLIIQQNCNVFTCVKYFIICARIMRILSDTNFRSCNVITCTRLICSLTAASRNCLSTQTVI